MNIPFGINVLSGGQILWLLTLTVFYSDVMGCIMYILCGGLSVCALHVALKLIEHSPALEGDD